jgi:hypothetical protein
MASTERPRGVMNRIVIRFSRCLLLLTVPLAAENARL